MKSLDWFHGSICSRKAHKSFSRKLLAWVRLCRALILISHNIELVETVKRELQKVMLVLPRHLTLCKVLALSRTWWGVGDFSDEVCCGSLGHPVHEYPDEGGLQHNGKSKGEAEEHSLTITEPAAFLLRCELDATEVWFKLGRVSGAG